MTNENPRGLPVAHELREIIGNEYMDETARRRLLAFADRLATDYAALLAEVEAMRDRVREVWAAVPSNWCDPLLTGPDAVGKIPYDCPAVERLLHGIRSRIAEIAAMEGRCE